MLGSSLLCLALLAAPPPAGRAQAIESMNRAVEFAEHGNLSGAERALRETLAVDPELDYAWLNLGHVYRRKGQPIDAEFAFRSGLKVSEGPVAVELRYQLGRVLLERREEPGVSHDDRNTQTTEALEQLLGAVEAEPHRVRALRLVAEAHRFLEQPDKADAAYRKAIERDPTYSPAYEGLALMYVDFGHANVALAVLEVNLQVNPTSAGAWAALGDASARLGRPADAIEGFEKALRIDPDLLDVRFGLGMAHAELRHRREAVEHLQIFLQRSGDDVSEHRQHAANDTIARMQDVL